MPGVVKPGSISFLKQPIFISRIIFIKTMLLPYGTFKEEEPIVIN